MKKIKKVVLMIHTDNIKRTMQMIGPLVKSETYRLVNGIVKDYVVEAGDWKHIKKKGK